MAINNNELIPQSTLKEIDDYNNKVVKAAEVSENLLIEVQKITSEFNKVGSSFKTINDLISKQNDIEKKLIESNANLVKAQNDLVQAQQKAISVRSEEAKSIENNRKAYEDNTKAVSENAKTLKDISTQAYEEAKKSIKGQYEELIKLNQTQAVLENQLKSITKEYKLNNISRDEYIKRTTILKRDINDQKSAIKNLSTEIRLNEKVVDTQIGSYNNLSAQYSRLKIQINQMTDAEKYNGLTKKELEARAKAIYTQMSNLQKATGKSQLDVGKYSEAVDGLKGIFSKLNPTLASAATGISAVGKQMLVLLASPVVATIASIVVVFTALYYATKKLTSAAESNEVQFTKMQEAMAPVHVMSDKLTNSLYPLAAVWVSVASATGQAIARFSDWLGITDNMVEKTKEYVQHEKDSLQLTIYRREAAKKNALAEKEIAELQADVADKANLSDTERLAKIDKIDKLQTEIFVRRKTEAVIKDRLLKEEASRTASSTEMNDKLNQSEIDLINIDKESANSKRLTNRLRQSSINSLLSDLQKQETAVEKYNKAIEKLAVDNAQALIETDEIKFRNNAAIQKAIITNEQKSYEVRMEAANEFENMMGDSINSKADKQIEGLKGQYNKMADLAKKSRQTIKSFEELFGPQIATIRQKQDKDLTDISIEGAKSREDILKDSVSKQIKTLKTASDTRNKEISLAESDALAELSGQYSKGEIKSEEYEKRKTDIAIEYARQRLENEIASLNSLLSLTELSSDQRESIEKQLQDKQLEFYKFVNQQKTKSDDDEGKKREKIEKKLAELKKELAKESLNFLSAIWDAETERNLAKLEKQSEDNQNWRDEELERIERLEESGAISKEQADARKELVEQQAKERERLIEEEKKKAQIEQAKRDKLIAIAMAGINTAKAITAVLPNFVLAALVGALGAIQIGTILATPIPQYEKGTGGHIGGPAIVGEKRHEMIITPDGSIFKTPNVPTLVDMPKGTIVMPDYIKALANMNAERLPKDASDNITIFESVKQIKKIDESNKLLKQLNRNINLGNQAIQREIIYGNSMSLKRSLINKHK